MSEKRVCLECGRTFEAVSLNQDYCSICNELISKYGETQETFQKFSKGSKKES